MKKIIQLPVRIPEWMPTEIESYITSLLKDYDDKLFKETFEKEKN